LEDNRPSPTPVQKVPEGGLTVEEAWEDLKLGQIFRVALRVGTTFIWEGINDTKRLRQPNPKASSSGYMVLEDLRKDLEDEMAPEEKDVKSMFLHFNSRLQGNCAIGGWNADGNSRPTLGSKS
jgi:hypothetical protein